MQHSGHVVSTLICCKSLCRLPQPPTGSMWFEGDKKARDFPNPVTYQYDFLSSHHDSTCCRDVEHGALALQQRPWHAALRPFRIPLRSTRWRRRWAHGREHFSRKRRRTRDAACAGPVVIETGQAARPESPTVRRPLPANVTTWVRGAPGLHRHGRSSQFAVG